MSDPSNGDVRMRGFTQRTSVSAALQWLDQQLFALGEESLPLAACSGRVLARDLVSSYDLPRFPRAMMDGIAIQSRETLGADPLHRIRFEVIADSLPGRGCLLRVQKGEAVRIMTGAPMPEGADAVVPVECVTFESHLAWVQDEIQAGKNVALPGEDVAKGSVVLNAGRWLRPQDLGLLSSLGCDCVPVHCQPRVAMVVTGNELLPPGTPPHDFQVADANSPMLRALVNRDGGIIGGCQLIADDPQRIHETLLADADVVLVTGGSSVGQEDYAPGLLARHGELAIHGIAMRPGGPTGMGTLEGRLVFLLPGNPVSCLCAYDFFAGRAIRSLGGRSKAWPYSSVRCRLDRELASVEGRVDYVRVRIVPGNADAVDCEPQCEPLFASGGSMLSSATQADGFVIIPAAVRSLAAGSPVVVHRYDHPWQQESTPSFPVGEVADRYL